jgi:hypothetical protein
MFRRGAVGVAHAEVDDVFAAAAGAGFEFAGDIEDVRGQPREAGKFFHDSLILWEKPWNEVDPKEIVPAQGHLLTLVGISAKKEKISMKPYQLAAALLLPLASTGMTLAQSTSPTSQTAPTAPDAKQIAKQDKQQEKAAKAQAKADKEKAKADQSKSAKKADKAQAKADKDAAKADKDAAKTATPPS